MNAELQSQLDRVEAALKTLTDSITSYNPDLSAAKDLLAADAVFQAGIEKQSHQRNHLRLLSLHSTASSLSASLSSSLTVLASTRASILATSVPSLPALSAASSAPSTSSRRPVPHAELLSVARNTAAFAAPQPFVSPSDSTQQPPPPPPPPPLLPTTDLLSSSAQLVSSPQNAASAAAAPKPNPGIESLDAVERAQLDPSSQMPYLPWPSGEMLAKSGLARVQGWSGAVQVLEGEDASAVEAANGTAATPDLVAGKAAGAEERREDAVVQDKVLEGAVQRPQAQLPVKEKPKVFLGLDLYDPEDD